MVAAVAAALCAGHETFGALVEIPACPEAGAARLQAPPNSVRLKVSLKGGDFANVGLPSLLDERIRAALTTSNKPPRQQTSTPESTCARR